MPLTREEVVAMVSGRELDALVAEHVFNYKRGKTARDIDGNYGGDDILVPPDLSEYYTYPPRGKIPFSFHAKRWSTDLETAWEVVERLKSILNTGEHSYTKFTLREHTQKLWEAYWHATGDAGVPYAKAIAPTIPEAICKAALLAVMLP